MQLKVKVNKDHPQIIDVILFCIATKQIMCIALTLTISHTTRKISIRKRQSDIFNIVFHFE